ncbi:MAG: hypothetical protein F4Y67_05250 [Chloroflexi bacterium]|nr:hypothetical protein [Chloroflexota bacterium]MDE2862905.1 hypothetical protein [Chloroflexota bacterium]MDE2935443.1 hypothetical protein [Chloroflexota bacterium]MXW27659.1 hypothetical protein [Chloroflexota bacterium]MXX66693.1 hypothetical protein [Chloroflexota bacterium]
MELVRLASAVCISLFAVLAAGLAGIAATGGPNMPADQFLFMMLINPFAGLLMAATAWAAVTRRIHHGMIGLGMALSALSVAMAIRFAILIAEGQMPGLADAPLILATAPILGLVWGSLEMLVRWRTP